jgi:hypothetical protein
MAHEIETLMAVDRDAGVLDLRIYTHQSKRRRAEFVGTAMPSCVRKASDRGGLSRQRGQGSHRSVRQELPNPGNLSPVERPPRQMVQLECEHWG